MKKIILYTCLLITASLGLLTFIVLSDEKNILAIESYNNPESAYKLGHIYLKEGDNDNARKWFEIAINDGVSEAGAVLYFLYTDPRNSFHNIYKAEDYMKWAMNDTPEDVKEEIRNELKSFGIEPSF